MRGGAYREEVGSAEPEGSAAIAIDCAASAARRFLLSAGAFRDSVSAVETGTYTYARALFSVERRTLRVETRPAYGSRRGELDAPFDLGQDPWAISADALEEHRVLTCPECAGTAKVACGRCGGDGRVRCGYCGGSGRVMGKRKLKNCPDCRGSGTRKCESCTSGKVPCGCCAAVGRVVGRLRVDSVVAPRVTIAGESKAHPAVREPADFDIPGTWPGNATRDFVPDSIEAVPAELVPQLAPPYERVVSARVQIMEAPLWTVRYRAATGEGAVEVAGRHFVVARSNWTPLWLRLGLASLVGFMGWSAGTAAWSHYVARGPWYASYGASGPLAILAIVLGAAAFVSALSLLVSGPARRPTRVLPPLTVLGATGMIIAAGMVLAVPNAGDAQRALRAGDLARADAAARAVLEREPRSAEAIAVLDTLHLRRLSSASSVAEMAAVLDEPWLDGEVQRQAEASFRDRALDEERREIAAGDSAGLHALASTAGRLGPEFVDDAERRSAELRVDEALAQRDWTAVDQALAALTEHDASDATVSERRAAAATKVSEAFASAIAAAAPRSLGPRERLGFLETARTLAPWVERFSGSATDPPPDRLERELQDARTAVERLEAREARELERQRAREQREAERQRQREERARNAWRYAPLLCGDGSLSPSCTCGGSHRGCCSRHGGVAGCSR